MRVRILSVFAALLFVGLSEGRPAAAQAVALAEAPAKGAPSAEKAIRTTDEILQKYEIAMGGREAWSKITTRWMKGIYQTEDASLFAAIEVTSEFPNKAFTKITFPNGITVREVCDGKSAWLEDPRGGLHGFSGAALQSRLHSANFGSRADVLRSAGPGKVLGTGKVGAHAVYIVEFEPEKGVKSKVYFDTESGLAVRTDDTIQKDGGDYTVETYLDDYRAVDGAFYPFRMRHVEKGNVFTVRVTQIKNNAPVDETIFLKSGTVASTR